MEFNDDRRYMQRAMELAVKALGRTSPNPVVGAVIVKKGEVVGEGYHKKAGTPHAEIHALNAAQGEARDATVYVTLEPCSHFGKTPPCASALIEAGVKRVVVATTDPNPKVSGKGIEMLRAAGITVEAGLMEEEAKKLNEFFFKYITGGMPFISLKYAMTMDGKIATASGSSRWISSTESRQHVHQLRNIYDAIMIGIGTLLSDNPHLNCRLEGQEVRDPIRVVIDGHLEIPLDSTIARTSREQKTLIFTSSKADLSKISQLEKLAVELIVWDADPENLPMDEVFKYLAKRGICSVLVEGGARLNGCLLDEHLVDKVYGYIAPKLVGGNGPSPIIGKGIEQMTDALTMTNVNVTSIGQDVLIEGYIRW